jgi:hypothetical protein
MRRVMVRAYLRLRPAVMVKKSFVLIPIIIQPNWMDIGTLPKRYFSPLGNYPKPVG